MKTLSLALGIAISVSSIVLSLVVPVNHVVRTGKTGSTLVADGTPLPPVPPPPPPPKNG